MFDAWHFSVVVLLYRRSLGANEEANGIATVSFWRRKIISWAVETDSIKTKEGERAFVLLLLPKVGLTKKHAHIDLFTIACIVYTWDYRSSIALWQGFRTQPMLGDEVQTFKALISVHKIIREGHPSVSGSSPLLE